MASKELIAKVKEYDSVVDNAEKMDKSYADAYAYVAHIAIEQEHDIEYGLMLSRKARKCLNALLLQQRGYDIWYLERYAQENNTAFDVVEEYYELLLLEAPHCFESYLYYMEKDRPCSKRFYQPRQKTLKIVVDDLQELEEGKLIFYGLSMPPRVGKSTINIFFLSWVMGRNPYLHNAMGGHSGLLAKGFYKEELNLITSADYKFSTVFPDVQLVDKSAEDFTIFFRKDRFASFTARGIDGTWTGAVDISSGGYLYVDDLIRDRQESLSPVRLEGRYQDYLNVMVDRKNDGAKELMVATRWNLFDPLGRCEVTYKDNPKARFRKIPALNENDESNFDYDCGVGFSTQYYKDLRDRLDANEWMAKYQQQPFLREGLLFPSDELNYFNGVLPEGKQSVLSAIDVAMGGGDNLSMPIGVCIGENVYVTDWVFSNKDKFTTRPLVVSATIRNGVQRLQIEGNAGGREYAEVVENMLQEEKYPVNITTPRADNTKSKNERIIQYSADIKRNFYFLEPKLMTKEYRNAMEELNMFVVDGKNLHDDAADSLTQLCDMFLKGNRTAKVEAIYNPFWGSAY